MADLGELVERDGRRATALSETVRGFCDFGVVGSVLGASFLRPGDGGGAAGTEGGLKSSELRKARRTLCRLVEEGLCVAVDVLFPPLSWLMDSDGGSRERRASIPSSLSFGEPGLVGVLTSSFRVA